MSMNLQVDPHVERRYKIVRYIGGGAYGVVWKAIDRRTRKLVALKKVFDAFTNDTDAQRTYREAMLLLSLHHVNIVKLLNIVRSLDDVDLYMVFELQETDVHAVIKANILQNSQRQYISYQLVRCTHYLHCKGVIHRDLKPANVLINSNCTIKLADFGLARCFAIPTEPARAGGAGGEGGHFEFNNNSSTNSSQDGREGGEPEGTVFHYNNYNGNVYYPRDGVVAANNMTMLNSRIERGGAAEASTSANDNRVAKKAIFGVSTESATGGNEKMVSAEGQTGGGAAASSSFSTPTASSSLDAKLNLFDEGAAREGNAFAPEENINGMLGEEYTFSKAPSKAQQSVFYSNTQASDSQAVGYEDDAAGKGGGTGSAPPAPFINSTTAALDSMPPLTDYIATRWYRAPELLCGTNSYTTAIDMWAAGCIIAELFLGTPLFKGSSTDDQLQLIVCALGKPTEEDLAGWRVASAERMVDGLRYHTPATESGPYASLYAQLSSLPRDAAELVKMLLCLDPFKRLTSLQALQHPYISVFATPEELYGEENEGSPAAIDLATPVFIELDDGVKHSLQEYRTALYEQAASLKTGGE